MGLFARILSALGRGKAESNDNQDADAERDASESGDADADADGTDDIDPERDLELEAKDDAGSFDFAHDIARYFTAEFRIEQAWGNRERRDQLLAEYDLRDGAHWYQVKATFKRWLASPEGKQKYPNEDALVQARMTTTQTVTVDELEQMIEDARRARGQSGKP